jgi:hypothetical protein
MNSIVMPMTGPIKPSTVPDQPMLDKLETLISIADETMTSVVKLAHGDK